MVLFNGPLPLMFTLAAVFLIRGFFSIFDPQYSVMDFHREPPTPWLGADDSCQTGGPSGPPG